MTYTVFEYLYRDAANFKAYGSVWLRGECTEEQQSQLIESLEDAEFFIAEQIGLPPLYDELFDLSGGPTESDHVWHSFDRVRTAATLPNGVIAWGDVPALITSFKMSASRWNPALSENALIN